MNTVFICLGGTGTQLGCAIGNLYPLLQLSGIKEKPFSMFIMDKDTNSGIFKACTGAFQRYQDSRDLLPFDTLPPYELKHDVYQEMQKSAKLYNKNYTVMDLIGNEPADPVKELAAMCWTDVKRNESLYDGNNRDPSRGSLDASVCLEHFEQSSLFIKLQSLKEKVGENDIRVVILGGVTGGMGSSLIVPLAKKIRTSFSKLRIDMVLLGTYFEIPQRKTPPPGTVDVDNIGTSLDSFYRAADQIEELIEVADNNWRVYYTAMPGFDNTAGEFAKNKALPRKAHLLELTAALAAFVIGEENSKPGFYQTSLSFGDDDRNFIDWTDIPQGNKLKKNTENFLKLVSVVVCMIYPALCADTKNIRGDNYLKKYFKKNPADEMEIIGNMRDILKVWLQNIKSYFEFWNEIQNCTRLGFKDGKKLVNLFNHDDMDKLSRILGSEQADTNEKLPLYGGKRWLNFIDDLNPDKELKNVFDARAKLKGMFKDIWNIYYKEG